MPSETISQKLFAENITLSDLYNISEERLLKSRGPERYLWNGIDFYPVLNLMTKWGVSRGAKTDLYGTLFLGKIPDAKAYIPFFVLRERLGSLNETTTQITTIVSNIGISTLYDLTSYPMYRLDVRDAFAELGRFLDDQGARLDIVRQKSCAMVEDELIIPLRIGTGKTKISRLCHIGINPDGMMTCYDVPALEQAGGRIRDDQFSHFPRVIPMTNTKIPVMKKQLDLTQMPASIHKGLSGKKLTGKERAAIEEYIFENGGLDGLPNPVYKPFDPHANNDILLQDDWESFVKLAQAFDYILSSRIDIRTWSYSVTFHGNHTSPGSFGRCYYMGATERMHNIRRLFSYDKIVGHQRLLFGFCDILRTGWQIKFQTVGDSQALVDPGRCHPKGMAREEIYTSEHTKHTEINSLTLANSLKHILTVAKERLSDDKYQDFKNDLSAWLELPAVDPK